MNCVCDSSDLVAPIFTGDVMEKKSSGFTLIEIMVVVVILGVLSALIVPNVIGGLTKLGWRPKSSGFNK